jgi:hypothetical protein
MCVVATNIDCIRTSLMLHQHSRDQVFGILQNILKLFLRSQVIENERFVVSENTFLSVDKAFILVKLSILISEEGIVE